MRYRGKASFLETYWYSFNDEPVATRGSLLIPRLSLFRVFPIHHSCSQMNLLMRYGISLHIHGRE